MKRRSQKEVGAQLEKLLKEISTLKKAAEKEKLEFVSLDEKELVKAIKRKSANSPFPFAQAWSPITIPGGPASYAVSIYNPDPVGHPLVVSVFFGIANFLDDIGIGIAGRDIRWPYLSTPSISLWSGATTTQNFSYNVPSGIPDSLYYGNAVLWAPNYSGQGFYWGRAVFPVRVT